ncbi:hypothetical protein MycrhN_6283 [Mycolicibacterium rhodesiae NBB3]|jgi:hypothetical protein|uniref:DUF302 domain-containing protein n=1 Tax=Mycolicibacterium rhodesiae (strain NBB3) TaxID=710685 RepID=G8RV01_MYCRN|nr:DUF302 domain-containing protein [Mycolicibacterium rhodesiae]AEV76741.1 hypothetical protein MycrhN_6283 [Mycolicibacterium rhodesiae NBB3]
MSTSDPQTIPFDGVRLRYSSTKSFDELVNAVLNDVGREPVPIDDIGKLYPDWESYEHEVQSHVGPHGFMLFGSFNHGGWIAKAGIHRKVLRLVIGNPLIAITMISHDVTAGLFAPVELLLTEEENDTSALTYVVPSSLMVVEPNPPLLSAAQALDAKLAALAADVSGT